MNVEFLKESEDEFSHNSNNEQLHTCVKLLTDGYVNMNRCCLFPPLFSWDFQRIRGGWLNWWLGILWGVIKKLILKFTHLALYEGAQEHEDGDASAHYEVDEIPESKTTHFAQCHLLHLKTQSVPLITQLPLKAHQHHLQSCVQEEVQRELQWLLLL